MAERPIPEQTPDPAGIAGLIRGVLADLRALLRTELALAKAEMSDNLARAGGGLALIGVALLMVFVALCALAVSATFGVVALGVPLGWAALIVAVAFIVLAAILALIGKSRLSPDALRPDRTIAQVKSDIHAVKEISRV
ncbi:phage holin family protein [Marivita sp. GX14005]|uniref:phage holin family protein n=1 Tax=Marivita sp. GX14005 TaxID=2942276 RepID=UPI0020187F10|nr:phage holin family protein [Marivita sp. GX14005]MCL3880742.1 phage holin family protein [Marivita sp. GX14005]